MVDVSLRAGLFVLGSVVSTQSVMFASGDSGVPLGLNASVSGSTNGKSLSEIPTGS